MAFICHCDSLSRYRKQGRHEGQFQGRGDALGEQFADRLVKLVGGTEIELRSLDDKAAELSFEISQKIQTDMTYPGQVKVTVIREKRAVHYAK